MDVKTDDSVVVVGAGLAGLATAITAADRGLRVTVLECADMVGGAAAYSGGMVWVPGNHVMAREGLEDNLEDAATYIETTAADYPDLLETEHMWHWLRTGVRAAKHFEDLGAVRWRLIPKMPDYFFPDTPGCREEGRFLTAVFDGADLGEWRDRLLYSPHFPADTTYDELFGTDSGSDGAEAADDGDGERRDPVGFFSSSLRGRSADRPADLLTMGTGVVASFLHRALTDERIEIRPRCRVSELVTEDGAVVGVRADGPDGPEEHRGPVVIATSGYDWDPDLVEGYALLEKDDVGSVAPDTLRGDGMRLAASVGGANLHFPPRCMPMVPGNRTSDGGYRYNHEFGYPHTFMVDRDGQRFADDSYYRNICWHALDPDDRRLPVFQIWDAEHHRRYGGAGVPPGAPYPPDVVVSAPTLRELGAALGMDGEQLERTAERFNEHAVRGEDPDFGRGHIPAVRRFSGDPNHELHPNVAPVTEPPFHAMRARFIIAGIGMSGIRVDTVGRALGADGDPVPGLYAAGAAAAFTSSGTGYQSGYSLSRAITLGLTVGEVVGEDVPAGATAAGETR